MLLKIFLVFYGYLSLSFGWIFYLVVFTSFGIAIYKAFKSKDLYQTAEGFIKTITALGIADLTFSAFVATFLTVKWLLGF
jgi:ABC-type uncharacterized transport system substrate-binding protein